MSAAVPVRRSQSLARSNRRGSSPFRGKLNVRKPSLLTAVLVLAQPAAARTTATGGRPHRHRPAPLTPADAPPPPPFFRLRPQPPCLFNAARNLIFLHDTRTAQKSHRKYCMSPKAKKKYKYRAYKKRRNII
jgi:hypothetical protein